MHPAGRAHNFASSVGKERAKQLAIAALLLLCSIVSSASAEPRADWVISQINQKNASLSATFRAEKYTLMAETMFAFFRATNYLFWADYGSSPLLATFGGPTTRVWLQGDAHCDNVSALLTNQNTVVFDLDDFDETLIADYQLDLWRMAVSILLAISENGGLPQKTQEQLIDAFASSYLNTLRSYRDNVGELITTYSVGNTPSFLSDWMVQLSEQTHLRVLKKMTTVASGKRMFDYDKQGVQQVAPSVLQAIQAAMPAYQATLTGRLRQIPGYFRIKDVAQKTKGGMGSLGVTRYFVLIEGVSASQDDDRILDIKAQSAPAGWQYMDPTIRDQLLNQIGGDHALRVVLGYRAMGYRSDEHLGSLSLQGERFFVRERTPVRSAFELSNIANPQRALPLVQQWGAVLATAHARADQDSSPLIPYELEKEVLAKVATDKQRQAFLARVRQIAFFYAKQVGEDYKAFKDWQTARAPVAAKE
ncbi:MAG: DUF2252 family protein [Myxococcales bacterium]|nr:DUF2252 family protein [Myxococcales bacterium]